MKKSGSIGNNVIAELVEKKYSINPEAVEPIIRDFAMTKIAGFKTLYRSPFGANGDRFYFMEGCRQFFSGYSAWTEKVLWEDKRFLQQWREDEGADRAELLGTSAREYGSLLHLVISMHEDPKLEYTFRFDDPWWFEVATEVAKANLLPSSVIDEWTYKIKNDMAAYFQWKKDMKVQVLAVEVPLYDTEFMVATPGDLVVSMELMVNDAPGKKKYPIRVVAGVDIKSGDKTASYDKYRLQLEFMRYAWNKMGFATTEYEMTHIFNWRPSPRAKRPGAYILTNQSGYFTQKQVRHLGKTNKIMNYNMPTGGVLEYYDGSNAEEFKTRSFSPLQWLRRWQNDKRKSDV